MLMPNIISDSGQLNVKGNSLTVNNVFDILKEFNHLSLHM